MSIKVLLVYEMLFRMSKFSPYPIRTTRGVPRLPHLMGKDINFYTIDAKKKMTKIFRQGNFFLLLIIFKSPDRIFLPTVSIFEQQISDSPTNKVS